jgi:hypothetical protein
MKTSSAILLVLMLTLAPTTARGDFYVIPGGGTAAGTEIKSLPHTITAPGFYFIKKNLTCSAASHGITVSAPDVTLDLMGFCISGTANMGNYDGVYLNEHDNVEIRNGTIRSFGRNGILNQSGGCGHRIINMRLRENSADGLYLGGKNNTVASCTAMHNGGRGIFAGFRGIVRDNACYQNASTGLEAGNGSIVTGNSSYRNEYWGIRAYNGSTVSGNTAFSNDNGGMLTAEGSTVTGNTCCFNKSNYGIQTGNECLVMGNTAYSNTGGNIKSNATCTFVNNHTGP